ncbi:MAG: hypothetical protein IBJ05_10905, partial [Blastomonas sp.]|nr:hypothetical protein [Blastomonas sp.]
MRVALPACLLLAGCSVSQAGGDDSARTPLDAAAIDAGVIADPQAIDLAGSFADPGATGSDAFCARGNRASGYKVGMLVTFGASSQCEGTGSARLAGETAAFTLSRDGDGDALVRRHRAGDAEAGVAPDQFGDHRLELDHRADAAGGEVVQRRPDRGIGVVADAGDDAFGEKLPGDDVGR